MFFVFVLFSSPHPNVLMNLYEGNESDSKSLRSEWERDQTERASM